MRLPRLTARRTLAALLLALLLAPGTLVRSPVPDRYTTAVTMRALPFDEQAQGPLQVLGLWQLRSAGENFGGYSAMLLLGKRGIRLFSDRGYLLNVPRPGGNPSSTVPFSHRQLYPVGIPLIDLLDIESVTRSGDTGQYWVGYEGRHTIYRYSVSGEPEAYVEPDYTRTWRDNGGIEAMVRLRSGWFIVFHEGGDDLFLYREDPVTGGEPVRLWVDWPTGYVPTDAAELPDGRLVLLLRRVALHLPPFESRLVLLDPLDLSKGQVLPVHMVAQLEDLLPRDNWEALAVEQGDLPGQVSLWLASDDNRSGLQRSLLAQLRFTLP